MKKIYCVKCGIIKDLKKYDTVYFKISENSNPNVMKFENCYVCKKCEKLASKLIPKLIKKITFFTADKLGYHCELNKFIESTEDVEQFNTEITILRSNLC